MVHACVWTKGNEALKAEAKQRLKMSVVNVRVQNAEENPITAFEFGPV